MAYDPATEAEWPTLYNLSKMRDPDGSLATVAAVYSQCDDAVGDMPFKEANGKNFHRITVEDSMPEGTWRLYNQGIRPKTSGTLQVDEAMATLENRAEVDELIARDSGDIPKYRKQKGDEIVRGLGKQVADALFYSDTKTYPAQFAGIAPRYDALGKKTDTFGSFNPMDQVFSQGGATSGALTSIYLIGWGLGTVYGITPQGSKEGIEQKDLGVIDLRDSEGRVFQGYAEQFRISVGLCVEDYRYINRLANISVAATIQDSELTLLMNNLIDMSASIPDLKACRPTYYMNRSTKAFLTKLAYTKTNAALSIGDIYGEKNVTMLNGIPIHMSDSIKLTEAKIS